MHYSGVLLPQVFKLTKISPKQPPPPQKKTPFNQSWCQKGRVKIVNIQRRAVKIICGMHGRRARHEKRNSKPWDHFIWKGRLPQTQRLQYNKLTTGIGKANQGLVFTFPPKHKNQTVSRIV